MKISKILDFLFPENISCIFCGRAISKKNKYSMWNECYQKIVFIKDGCYKCGKPYINYDKEKIKNLEQNIKNCNYCINKNFVFDRNISCIEYDKNSKKLVFSLKYNDATYMAKIIAEIMYKKLIDEQLEQKINYVTSVPLSKKRIKKRGFNQSGLIAYFLSEKLNVQYLKLADRIKETKPLYKLSKKQRKLEIKNAFKVNENINKIKEENATILIVDDIFTTGATVNEVSKILKKIKKINLISITLLTRVFIEYTID